MAASSSTNPYGTVQTPSGAQLTNSSTPFTGGGTGVQGIIARTAAGASGQTQQSDGSFSYNSSPAGTDPDAQALQALINEDAAASQGRNNGVSFNTNAAQEAVYRGRIAEKNSLSAQISEAPGLLNSQQDQNKAASGAAIGQGLKETNQNYNNRGLLYSGNRVAGDQQVTNQGAATLASNMAGTAQDSANTLAAQQNAYANVDLAGQQQSLTLANQAFDTANANNIARLQAMQQLGSGVGAAAGQVAGNYFNPSPSTVNPTTGWQPQQLQPTGLMTGS